MELWLQKSLEFISTSYVRGITISNAIIVLDEFQNMSGHEIDSLVTRMGDNCKIILCGDTQQSDLIKDKLQHNRILDIFREMREDFKFVEFGVRDIVRSGIVKRYLTTKYKMGV